MSYFASVVSAAILSLAPVGDRQADMLGAAIAGATDEDTAAAALLVVTAFGESSFRSSVGECRIRGIEGDGYFGLGVGWGRFACARADEQARCARQAFGAFDPEDPTEAVRLYAGAKSAAHPTVVGRIGLYWVTRWRIELAACI